MDNKDDNTGSETDELLANFLLPERLEKLESVLNNRTENLTIVLDNIKNYHNISAVIRTADAFGVNKIHLVAGNFEYTSGISLGAEKWLEIEKHKSSESVIKNLKEQGYKLVVMQPESFDARTPMAVNELPFEEKLALVFGNEKNGVAQEFKDSADIFAFIPMYGFVESLNISVACAITVFCSTIPKAKTARRVETFSEEKKTSLKSRWLKQDVKNSDIILKDIERRKEFT